MICKVHKAAFKYALVSEGGTGTLCHACDMEDQIQKLRAAVAEDKPDKAQIADGQIIKMQTDEIAMLRAVVKADLRVLERLEWARIYTCPICHGLGPVAVPASERGHSPSCPLSTRIRSLRGIVEEK